MSESNKAIIKGWTNRIMSIETKDGREFIGRFVCVDNKMNTILKDVSINVS